MKNYLLTILTLTALVTSVSSVAIDQNVRVLAQKPIPRTFFTQGLEFDGNELLVSSGLYRVSKLLRLDFASMDTIQEMPLDPGQFAEGITVLNDRIYQLTWRSGQMLVRDRKSFEEIDRWSISGEGWGITNNGNELIYSNGSHHLIFADPSTGATLRTLEVTLNNAPVSRLNELEWIDGEIWANIWGSNYIAIIDPETGIVTRRANLQGLLPRSDRRRDTDVLNGIARNPQTGAIWVTGKRWPWLYQIELVPNEPVVDKAAEIDTPAPPRE